MEELTTDKIIFIINKGPENLEKYYYEQMKKLCISFTKITSESTEWMRMKNNLIQANSMPGRRDREMTAKGGYKEPDRFSELLEKTERDRVEYKMGLYAMMRDASRKLEDVRRFRIVFAKVPEKWQNFLYRLYHDRVKWTVLVEESGMSNSTFARRRTIVMGDICRMYNSELSTRELASLPEILLPSDDEENKKEQNSGYEQMELDLKRDNG